MASPLFSTTLIFSLLPIPIKYSVSTSSAVKLDPVQTRRDIELALCHASVTDERCGVYIETNIYIYAPEIPNQMG